RLQRAGAVVEKLVTLCAGAQQHFGIIEQHGVLRRLLLTAQVGVGGLEVGDAAIQPLRTRAQVVQPRLQFTDAMIACARLLVAGCELALQRRDGGGVVLARGQFVARETMQAPNAPGCHGQGHERDEDRKGRKAGRALARLARAGSRGVFDGIFTHARNASRGDPQPRPAGIASSMDPACADPARSTCAKPALRAAAAMRALLATAVPCSNACSASPGRAARMLARASALDSRTYSGARGLPRSASAWRRPSRAGTRS